MTHLSAAVMTALALCPSATLAGWQEYEWGETPRGILATGEAYERREETRGAPPVRTAPIEMPYQAAGFAFSAYFLFDQAGLGRGLTSVVLVPRDADACDDILTEVRAIYGAPEPTREDATEPTGEMRVTWRDPRHEARVAYAEMGASCAMIYSRLLEPGADNGL